MLSVQGVIFVMCACSFGALSAKAPSYIHQCRDPTDACLTKAVQDAVPEFSKGSTELGVAPLDPFHVDEISLVLPGGLQIFVTDATFTGMRKCIIEKASLVRTTFEMNTVCNITVKGKYKAKGRILLFPINGNGDAKIKVSNIKLHVRMFTKNEKASDGKYHVVFKEYKTKHQWGDKVTYHLTNLFDGNPEISRTILDFLNQNWKTVADEFGQPLVDVAVKQVVNNVKAFFAALPYEELLHSPIILD